ncbi:inosine/guanosine kinase [Endozoicomonas ascidiicola]|uniref:inosine/guanosine kinase n=1 Tax=Endozoicomonas ascidiicola TaxID=1698521 RepID=UPI0008332E96|nr:inosine/guanosine kinase [Endozoicomonas ascidiicola]
MKFPGRRKIKHYFPVNTNNRFDMESSVFGQTNTYACGIDQNLVDITARVDLSVLNDFGLDKGASQWIDDDTANRLYEFLTDNELIEDQFAGGTIGNTLHNYSVLADDRSVQFGVMSTNIHVGDYAYRYLCNTSSKVDLTYLQPVNGAIGRCFALITDDGERTFGISPGLMNQLSPEFINEEIIAESSALVLCAYTLANPELPIYHAMIHAAELARKHDVPVILTLGTRGLVKAIKEPLLSFMNDYVNVAAMNEEEAEALTGESDPVQASEQMLQYVDMVLLTAGAEGLYLSGYTEKSLARETDNPIRSGAISDFNRFEFSRPLFQKDCEEPMKVYSHISPYMGGPKNIKNTNGAGDGALAALIHDMAANHYHRLVLPTSSKHNKQWITYSSFAQVCKYANRVSFEVLAQSSPRLSRALPEREMSLEDSYWDQ